MRLFLLPVSRTRILLYCDKLHPKPPVAALLPSGATPNNQNHTNGDSTASKAQQPVTAPVPSLKAVFFPPKPSHTTDGKSSPSLQEDSTILDRATDFAAATWTSWERQPSGVQKRITVYGNALLRRIPYEEWALKSVPPLTARRKAEYEKLFAAPTVGDVDAKATGKKKVTVLYPKTLGSRVGGEEVLPQGEIVSVVKRLALERQDLHRKRMIWSMIGAPLTLPFALVPVVPNIPGFYMLFRAWSHWRALLGAKHLEFLATNHLLEPVSDTTLSKILAQAEQRLERDDIQHKTKPSATSPSASSSASERDMLLLDEASGREVASAFGVPEIQVEIERAVEQVTALLAKPETETASPPPSPASTTPSESKTNE